MYIPKKNINVPTILRVKGFEGAYLLEIPWRYPLEKVKENAAKTI